MASYGCLSIQNKSKSTSHQSPVTSHRSFIICFTRHQSPGIQAWIKSPGIPYQSPVTSHPVTGHPGKDKITGHLSFSQLFKGTSVWSLWGITSYSCRATVTSTSVRSLCRIISDSYRVTVKSTSVRSLCRIISDFTGQQVRVLVSGHCVALLVTPTGQQLVTSTSVRSLCQIISDFTGQTVTSTSVRSDV